VVLTWSGMRASETFDDPRRLARGSPGHEKTPLLAGRKRGFMEVAHTGFEPVLPP
jgi:hypothetical protein